jgi:hypothetical protein
LEVVLHSKGVANLVNGNGFDVAATPLTIGTPLLLVTVEGNVGLNNISVLIRNRCCYAQYELSKTPTRILNPYKFVLSIWLATVGNNGCRECIPEIIEC